MGVLEIMEMEMNTAGLPPFDATTTRRRVSLVATLAHWNDARLTRRALRRMSRHELGDIGIDDLEAMTRL